MSAIDWAIEVLHGNYVILDCETTSLDGYVVQIGVVNMQGEVLLDTLVNPLVPISLSAWEVHGITQEAVKDAPKFAEIEWNLCQILRGQQVIAYNAEFDRSILRRDMNRLSANWYGWFDDVTWHCAMKRFSQFNRTTRWFNLQRACNILQVTASPDHSAAADAPGDAGADRQHGGACVLERRRAEDATRRNDGNPDTRIQPEQAGTEVNLSLLQG